MPNVSQYVHLVRTELEKLARAGRITKDLGAVIGKPPRWTLWKAVLDEVSYTKPDVTIIVLQASSGWPGQIDYSATNGKPTPAQKAFAQEELAKVFNAYWDRRGCRRHKAPYPLHNRRCALLCRRRARG